MLDYLNSATFASVKQAPLNMQIIQPACNRNVQLTSIGSCIDGQTSRHVSPQLPFVAGATMGTACRTPEH